MRATSPELTLLPKLRIRSAEMSFGSACESRADSFEARFKARGCVPSIACGSALTELLLRKSVVEARKLTPEDVISSVGGLPPASNHAAQLALDVLRAALNAANV